jgi:hypothetical protein
MLKKLSFFLVVVVLVLCTTAQTAAELIKIEASQAGASSLFYNPNVDAVTTIEAGSFYDEKECMVRGGLPNFFKKVNASKPVTVGYIGGSITQGNVCYRMQASKYMQLQYPNVTFKWMNAGVSGTGTDLGACRIKEQLLQHKPDLIFIEFAVNGAYQSGMEGIIRQIIKDNPETDICLLYAAASGHTKTYIEGSMPGGVKGLEGIAEYHNIPSIHLAMEAAQLEKDGKLIWKNDGNNNEGKIIFSEDGLHPILAGGNLYAAAVARGIQKMKYLAAIKKHTLPKALLQDNWEDAKMFSPLEVATFDNGWTKTDTKTNASLKQFNAWFPYVMLAEKPGSAFTFKFSGTMFGIFDIGGPEVGQIAIAIDGKPVKLEEVSSNGLRRFKVAATGNETLDRFNNFCNNRYRGQYNFIEIENGVHTVSISISHLKSDKVKILGSKKSDIAEHPERYAKTDVYLGRILLKGDIVK